MNADSAGYLLAASRSYKLVDTWLWQVAVFAKTFITRAVSLQNVTMVYCYRRLDTNTSINMRLQCIGRAVLLELGQGSCQAMVS